MSRQEVNGLPTDYQLRVCKPLTSYRNIIHFLLTNHQLPTDKSSVTPY